VRFWNVRKRRVRAELRGLHIDEISDLAFSPDARTLAVAGQDRVISLVDVVTYRPTITLTGHSGGVNRVAFSPDGRTLASASHDQSIRFRRGAAEMSNGSESA
jgi:WD40 repeat protein